MESSIDGESTCVDTKRLVYNSFECIFSLFGKNPNCLSILRVWIIFDLFKFINNISLESALLLYRILVVPFLYIWIYRISALIIGATLINRSFLIVIQLYLFLFFKANEYVFILLLHFVISFICLYIVMFTFVQMYLDAYIILRLKYTISAFCIFNPTPLNNSKYFIIVCKIVLLISYC